MKGAAGMVGMMRVSRLANQSNLVFQEIEQRRVGSDARMNQLKSDLADLSGRRSLVLGMKEASAIAFPFFRDQTVTVDGQRANLNR